MPSTLPKTNGARRGDSFAPSCEPERASASERKSVALACLNAAVDASGTPRKVLAADIGVSEQVFSKWLSGAEKTPLDLPERLPVAIGDDYLRRMQQQREIDPVVQVVARLAQVCVEALATFGSSRLPVHAGAPVKARLK